VLLANKNMSLTNWVQQTKAQTCNCLKTVCSEILECLEDAAAEDELREAASKGGIHTKSNYQKNRTKREAFSR
jgi:hypothetical protein